MTPGQPEHPDTHPDTDHLSPATRVVALGREAAAPGQQVGAPLVLSSTYHAGGEVMYARSGNPTWSAFEQALGDLEGGDALVFASGMAAVSAALSLLPHGGTVVAPDAAYNGVVATLEAREAEGSATVRRVDVTDTAAVIAPSTAPTCSGSSHRPTRCSRSPTCRRCSAPPATKGCSRSSTTPSPPPCCSARWSTGPTSSCTRSPSTSRGTAMCCSAPSSRPPHRPAGPCTSAWSPTAPSHGAIAGPMEVWLALRGLRTLHLRVERAQASARELATRLASHRAVTRVRHPGWGGIVSIEVAGGADAAQRVCESTHLWVYSTSLGGVESQLERRRRIPSEPPQVPENLVRLSVGIEDVDDLWNDLSQALDQA
jgi:cystathionine gamma-synthase